MVAVAIATRISYTDTGDAGLRVIVDHVAGAQLDGHAAPSGTPGDEVEIVVRVDGNAPVRRRVPESGASAVGVLDFDLPTDSGEITVELADGEQRTVLLQGSTERTRGERLTVTAVDVPPAPGVKRGREVFTARSLGACGVCHSTKPGDDGVGPSLAGVGVSAATRVPGLSAREYLEQSIIDPNAFVVEGFRADQMLDVYEQRLTADEIEALVEYLATLKEASTP